MKSTALILACSVGLVTAQRQQIPLLSTTSPRTTSSSTRILNLTFDTPLRAREVARKADEGGYDVWSRKGNSVILTGTRPRGSLQKEVRFDGVIEESEMGLEELMAQYPSLSALSNLQHSHSSYNNFTLSPSYSKPDTDPLHLTYHPYETLISIMQKFADDNPLWARTVVLGKTHEGREIVGLKVGNYSRWEGELEEEGKGKKKHKGGKGKGKGKGKKGELGVLIVGTQHAREWIAASTALYFAHTLLSPPHPILASLSFTIVPVSNPDGYAYTWSNDRLWRKNRQPVGGKNENDEEGEEECFGVDLNRNWGHRWSKGARANPCGDSYPGGKAFQALELQALRDYMLNKTNHIISYIDLHSFGQMLMYPYSYSCNRLSPDAEDQLEAVIGASKALKSIHGRVFETGSVCDVSLSGPGDSIDWTYAEAKIRWSFTFELRDAGVFGFLLPPQQILPAGQETTAALISLAEFVSRKERGKKNWWEE